MRWLMGVAAAAGLGGCDLVSPPADRMCLSDETRAGLLRALDLGAAVGRPPLAGHWEVSLSDVRVEGYDSDARRASCSADLMLGRVGASSGYGAGRVLYVVQQNVDGGTDYRFPDEPEAQIGLLTAVLKAVGEL